MRKISDKKLNGVVYTPEWIVNLILDKLDYTEDILDKKIIDPACGEGAFIKVAAERLIKDAIDKKLATSEIKKALESNIFGWDTDENAIRECKINLDEVASKYDITDVKWNLMQIDSLDKKLTGKYFGYFDFVVGNPPYIRIQHLGEERRKYIQREWKLCRKGSTDSFIAFFELGYYLLNENGELGYITPNTYLKTSASKDLRLFIKEKKILRTLIDFRYHQVFGNATTYSLITILSKKSASNFFDLYYGNSDEKIEHIDKIDINELNDDNWILDSNDVLVRIKEIENRGIPLGELADIHVGITTLADDYYIFKDPIMHNNTAIIRLKDGRQFKIEREILKPIIKASVLKSPDEEQNRFIIFPYRKIWGKHHIIPEKELSERYPLTYRYFLSIKDILLNRDKGKSNSVIWYAFGRSQGLDTSFGKKILTSGMNKEPNFIVWEREEYTFYAGYCIKYDGDLYELAKELNSDDMKFYIEHTSRHYQNDYKSYSKTFIKNFGIDNPKIIREYRKTKLNLFDIYDDFSLDFDEIPRNSVKYG